MSNTKVYKSMLKSFPDVLSVVQLKEILNISDKTVYKILKTNQIENIKVGRAYKIPKISVIQYLLNVKK